MEEMGPRGRESGASRLRRSRGKAERGPVKHVVPTTVWGKILQKPGVTATNNRKCLEMNTTRSQTQYNKYITQAPNAHYCRRCCRNWEEKSLWVGEQDGVYGQYRI